MSQKEIITLIFCYGAFLTIAWINIAHYLILRRKIGNFVDEMTMLKDIVGTTIIAAIVIAIYENILD